MTTRALALAAVLLIPLLTACNDDEPERLGSGDDYSVTAALGDLPASLASTDILIQTGDLDAASELAGVERPDAESPDPEAFRDWALALTGARAESPVFVPMAETFQITRLVEVADFRAELGWSVNDVATFVEQSTPPHTFAVISGDLDESTLPDELADLGDGVLSAGEGEDLERDPAGPTTARPLGTPLRTAGQDGRIAVSSTTEPVKSWLTGEGDTLADDDALAAVAEALDEQDVYAAVLSRPEAGFPFAPGGVGRITPEQAERILGEVGDLLPEDRFDVVGLGWGVEDGDAVATLVYHFDSSAAASKAAPRLEKLLTEGVSVASGQPLSDLLTLESSEADGEVVTVQVTMADGRPATTPMNMLMQRDLPFAHR